MPIPPSDAQRPLSGPRAPAPEDGSDHPPERLLASRSRTFRLASLLFPTAARGRVERLYAFCRRTDDLVDGDPALPHRRRADRLEAWLAASRAAYAGRPSGVAAIDGAMADAAAGGVPFRLVEELAEGMRMDLRHAGFETLAELDLYTYRVASVVGLWMARLYGIEEPRLLDRAAALGRGMQLTNILRDVGEDWRMGRLYLPVRRLNAHGLTAADVGALVGSDRGVPAAYARLVEELMAEAEADYAAALAVLPGLPPSFRRAVAVAAWLYRGIHDEIRTNGYDNLRRRARTGALTKAWLAGRGLADLAASGRGWRPVHPPGPASARCFRRRSTTSTSITGANAL